MKHEEATLKTKTALSVSLKKFMQKKPLGKITVSEIITDCNVNRKTFYYHFCDIYDLLKWTLEQEAIEIVKGFDLLSDYNEAVSFTLKYVKENAHILSCAYDSMGRDELKRFFYNDFCTITRNIVTGCEEKYGLSVSPEFKRFLSDLLTEAMAGMLVNAIQNNRLINEEEITRNISVIINSLPDILKRAE